MAMANPQSNTLKEEYDEILAEQSQFADEVFTFFLEFAKIDTDSARNINKYVGSKICTREVCETLLILSYILRPTYRKTYFGAVLRTTNAEDFENFIVNYKVLIDRNYMINFLVWVCFIIDFTVCCLRNDMDYIETAVHCLTFQSDVQHFHSQGGWNKLYEVCNVYSKAYAIVSAIICQELPMQQELEPFFCCSERMLKNRLLRIPYSPAMLVIREIRKNLLENYELVSNVNPSCVMGIYRVKKKITKVISQSSLTVSPENNSPMTKTQICSLKTNHGDVSPNISSLETSSNIRAQTASPKVSTGNVSQIPRPLQFSSKTRQQKTSPKSNQQYSENVTKILNKAKEETVTDIPKLVWEPTIFAEEELFTPLYEMKNVLVDEFSPPDKTETLLDESAPPDKNETLIIDESSIPDINETLIIDESSIPDKYETLIIDESSIPDKNETLIIDESSIPDKIETLIIDESSTQVGVLTRFSIVEKEHFRKLSAVEETPNSDNKHDLNHSAFIATNDIKNIANFIHDNMKCGNYIDIGNELYMVFPPGYSSDDKIKVINACFKEQENFARNALNNAILPLNVLCKWIFETRVKQESRATALRIDLAAEE